MKKPRRGEGLESRTGVPARPPQADQYLSSDAARVPRRTFFMPLPAGSPDQVSFVHDLVRLDVRGTDGHNQLIVGLTKEAAAGEARRACSRQERILPAAFSVPERIARTYHAWRGEKDAGKYGDIPGFCKSATTEEIATHGHVLTPGRYVGAEAIEDDGEPFEEKMQRLTETLGEQFAESKMLEKAIRANLAELGFEVAK